ncbi:MAG: P-II family nitrogen regulator [Saprospiraceae bacterium]|nr:P-II family nitrogen regulator [Saprospiraceae bacterium]
MKFKLIIAMVKPEMTSDIVDAAKGAGATGDVIIHGKGSGVHDSKSFFGLIVEDQTDVIMFLVEEHCVDNILGAIKEKGKFNESGRGIAFVLSVDRVAGLESQMQKFKDQVRDKHL